MKSKSKEAFSHNVGAEMNAGKPQKQALAIAYSVKRKSKRMAKGGEVPEQILPREKQEHDLPMEHPAEPEEHVTPEKTDAMKDMAKGGMVDGPIEDNSMSDVDDEFLSDESDGEYEPLETSLNNEIGHEEPDQQRSDIVSSILRSIRMKHMGRK